MTIVDGRNKSCITLLINMPALTNVMKTAYKTVENARGSALKYARNLGKAHGLQKEPGDMVEIFATTHDEYNKILNGLYKTAIVLEIAIF